MTNGVIATQASYFLIQLTETNVAFNRIMRTQALGA